MPEKKCVNSKKIYVIASQNDGRNILTDFAVLKTKKMQKMKIIIATMYICIYLSNKVSY